MDPAARHLLRQSSSASAVEAAGAATADHPSPEHMRYTSLHELLPRSSRSWLRFFSSPTRSPTSRFFVPPPPAVWQSDIAIRDPLLKAAAFAYLQPASPTVVSPHADDNDDDDGDKEEECFLKSLFHAIFGCISRR